MFRFFKKKTDQSDPSAADQQPDPEASQPAPEALKANQGVGIDHVPVSNGDPQLADEGIQTSDQTAPAVEDLATESPRVGLLSRWFKRNPEQPPIGGDVEPKPEDSADDGAVATASDAAVEDDLIGDAWVDDPLKEQTEESEQREEEAEQKSSWLAKLRGGLAKTGKSIGGIFVGVRVDEALFEELEAALIMADTGVEATERLLVALRVKVKQERIEDAPGVKQALRDVLAEHLRVLEKPFEVGRVKPLVVMMTGVNGAGKTTSIGKLAFCLQKEGARVLLAAGDTFRAAARQQLVEWGSRNNVDVIAQDGGDPAAVAFDAVNAGRARGMDVVMVDTAGRLPTQLHLMDELKKIRRVIAKADPSAPHEVLLVVDGNQGQNVLSQIRAFDAAVGLTGLIVTKLDGTAKGGTLAAVAAGAQGVRPIPVYWIGVGERIEDLQPFVAAEFAAAVVGQ
ncbi:MAG: signal recognition particle-docking protein FtsY [Alcaligenaceae bacterium]|nr:signal recognition particle-docking protein FtsY [Alcaligenaceae bacterium]